MVRSRSSNTGLLTARSGWLGAVAMYLVSPKHQAWTDEPEDEWDDEEDEGEDGCCLGSPVSVCAGRGGPALCQLLVKLPTAVALHTTRCPIFVHTPRLLDNLYYPSRSHGEGPVYGSEVAVADVTTMSSVVGCRVLGRHVVTRRSYRRCAASAAYRSAHRQAAESIDVRPGLRGL